MACQYIDLGEQAFLLINGLLISLNLAANIFYACRLIFPSRSRQRLKQPLKMLLGFLVWCQLSTAFLCIMYCLLKLHRGFAVFLVSWAVVMYFMHNSMTCYVWLNLYYCINIVPVQRAFLVWVKRNIKSVIFLALLFDGTLFSFTGAVDIAYATCIDFTYSNVSSFFSACYLHRHMRRMAQTGSCFSAPRIQSQLRVTITGISQGSIYSIYFTVITLYMLGTTFNLGVGQAVFRQRAANIWIRGTEWFKVPKAQQSRQGG
ncbi:LOW QUALITY PROTEIN: uncharacterized protein LOC127142840 [Lates calcarifer]|uniref:LOW QUALITY PROTEIN: uncharacterized protein LOC127142840 n=1 Tax=Lates calcarifer TaxID=8187 RepID=A0AAJ8BBZ9_LATCA|nr:LOW QUALITY PROTEIN: uncharacterized protein LOC127142840 [Lates calcarifer]